MKISALDNYLELEAEPFLPNCDEEMGVKYKPNLEELNYSPRLL